MTETTTTLRVSGMTCSNCERCIEKSLLKQTGILRADAHRNKRTVEVSYDPAQISRGEIDKTITDLGYEVSDRREKIVVPLLIGVLLFALYVLLEKTIGVTFMPTYGDTTALGALFVVGLFTSVHCVGMCGGINFAQSVSYGSIELDESSRSTSTSKFTLLRPSLLYNIGRVVSYTVIGALVGALGSVLQFSGVGRGIVGIVSGAAMVFVGLSLLNVIPWRTLPRPHVLDVFLAKIKSWTHGGPFVIGLLNALMPCGPLQAMQLSALGSGSALAGALSMFAFSLGTVPLMFTVGAAGSLLSSRFTVAMMRVSGVLVIGMGIVMASRGSVLSGGPSIFGL